jgi:superfamily II DNA or RNA helicase
MCKCAYKASEKMLLSRHGAKVPSELIDRDELLVQPATHKDFPALPAFHVLREVGDELCVPIHWAREKFPGVVWEKRFESSARMRVQFRGAPRDHQVHAVEQCMSQLRTGQRGILCLQTGGGKTFTSLLLATKLGYRTAVVVHKRTLLEQWADEIRRFVPGAKIGYLWQARVPDDDCDFVLIMWQTALRRRPKVTWNTLIVDECHHVCSHEFSKIMFSVNCEYAIGLSATPQRKDGLTDVLHWHLGPLMYEQAPTSRCTLPLGYVQVPFSADEYARFSEKVSKKYVALITQITELERRNALLVSCVQGVASREDFAHRHVLILTERVKHARTLVLEIGAALPGVSIGLFVGGLKADVLAAARKCKIIVATYKIFEEGENVESLDTIFFATPKKDIRQCLGRIFRKDHSVNPLVVDVVDSVLAGMSYGRKRTASKETNGHVTFSQSLSWSSASPRAT